MFFKKVGSSESNKWGCEIGRSGENQTYDQERTVRNACVRKETNFEADLGYRQLCFNALVESAFVEMYSV
jgi:hypothetical protein